MQRHLPRLLLAICAVLALASLLLSQGVFTPTKEERLALMPAYAPLPTTTPEPGSIAVNSASQEELMQLPGIGAHLAGQIIEARERSPFFYPEDLKAVPGIGDRRLEQIRPYIRID